MKAKAWTDGGNRAELAASACVILPEKGDIIYGHKLHHGKFSNNFAEYHGLIFCLEMALGTGISDLTIFSDSELIVNHLNGVYRVRSDDLHLLFDRVMELADRFVAVSIDHVPREDNAFADLLCNLAMNDHQGRGTPKKRSNMIVKMGKLRAELEDQRVF